ncbi:hypothetical protein [uncultured Tessaracoccus sp.]|uniref:hypothetical protein n=1 Tax=uncultured Tessaracoccus sp. TaxID=905023 RepID=UPI0026130DFF|nr:hypothetical protein [uncultured Tessaracoccus sp.]
MLQILLLSTAVVAFIASLAWGVLQALQLSPEQLAAKYLGEADVLYQYYVDEQDTSSVSDAPMPTWLRDLDPHIEHSSLIALRSAEGKVVDDVEYYEINPRSFALEGRFHVDGDHLPNSPGECLSNLSQTVWAPTVGSWQLEIVGTLQNVYSPSQHLMLCVPGTWNTWDVPASQSFVRSLDTSYYIKGDETSIRETVASVVQRHEALPANFTWRSHFLEGPRTNAKEFLGVVSVAALVVFSVPLIFSTRAASWVGKVQIVLSQAGISSKIVRTAGISTVCVGATAASIVASLTGSLVALVARPVLGRLSGGLPLGPWSLDVMLVLAVMLFSVGGALIGFLLGIMRDERQLSMRSRTAVALSHKGARAFQILTAMFVVIAGAVLWTSDGRFWPMTIGILLMVAASACAAPLLGIALGMRFAKHTASPGALAGRLIVEDGRRWATVFASLTAVVSVVCAVFINITASVAAQTELLKSPVPRGVVVVDMPSEEEGGHKLLEQMERSVGITHSAELTQTSYVVDGEGIILLVASLADAETILGQLPDEAKQSLMRGSVLRAGATDGPITVQAQDGSTLASSVVGYKPETGRGLALGYGYALQSSFPEEPESRTMWVYTGIDDEVESRLAEWPTTSGNNVVSMHRYLAQTGGLPLYLAGGFVVLAVASIPLCLWTMRREVEGLRPLAKGLDAIGLPFAWIWRVLCAIGGLLLAVPLALGLLAAVLSTGLLELLYPPVFDLAGVGWLGVAVGILTAAVVVFLVATLSARGVRKRRRSEVI